MKLTRSRSVQAIFFGIRQIDKFLFDNSSPRQSVAALPRRHVNPLPRCHVATSIRCRVAPLPRRHVGPLPRCSVAASPRQFDITLFRRRVASSPRCSVFRFKHLNIEDFFLKLTRSTSVHADFFRPSTLEHFQLLCTQDLHIGAALQFNRFYKFSSTYQTTKFRGMVLP